MNRRSPSFSTPVLKFISKPIRIPDKAQISEDLRLMDRQQPIHRFDLHDELTLHHDVQSIAAIETDFFVDNW